jgi:hypothetical protein
MPPDDVKVVILAVCLLGFGLAALAFRHRRAELRHKERLLAMEKGMELPAEPFGPSAPWSPRVHLLRGLLWLFTGVALAVTCLGISLTSRPVSAATRIAQAQSLRSRGATEEEVRQYFREAANRKGGPSPGVAFLGLIPSAVGLAYLVFYRGESAARRNEPPV